MRTPGNYTINNYNALRAQAGSHYEVRVVLGGTIYGMDRLKSLNVDPALFDGNGPQIGNAYSAQCTVELFEESANWPRMAQFDVEIRLVSEDGNQATGWFTFGRYYTDTRNDDGHGVLTIHAFDGMLKMEQTWADKVPAEYFPSSWPVTPRTFARMLQNAGLASFENLGQINYSVAFIGLNTGYTIRDVLKSIAAGNGGNWIMTADDRLRFVRFKVNPPEIQSESTTSQYVYLGHSAMSFDSSPALQAVSAVKLESSDGTVLTAGDEENGYRIDGECDFAATSGVAELSLRNVQGFVYRPFSATNAFLDPITEIGDIVAVDGIGYQVMRLSWTLGVLPVADMGADYNQEIDHEYTMPSAQAKTMRKTLSAADKRYLTEEKFATEIAQSESTIRLSAEAIFPTRADLNAEIQNLQNQIDGNIQSWSGNEVPTLDNTPAIDWTDPAEHVGDLYLVNTDAGIPQAGQYYRFEENNGAYSWQLLSDSAIAEALTQAQAAMAAAEGAQATAAAAAGVATLKGRIWIVQPTPPYSVGDLWFNSNEPSKADILTCTTARDSGSFVESDWKKLNKYTDDAAFAEFQTQYNSTISEIRNQLDQKAETYYQETDPAATWGAAVAGIAVAGIDKVGVLEGDAHTGDLWYRTSDNTTWFWDGAKWSQQDVPDDVFDKIDGKAQIFVEQPYTPYFVGDLWFNSDSEILTCMYTRKTGDFAASDWLKKNKYTDDSELNDFVNKTYNKQIAEVQRSLDGKIDTYFYAVEPTLDNVPASEWTTAELKDAHVDDLYYDTSKGYVYRFVKSGANYSWQRVKDKDITAAMDAASAAQDTADGKRRVFVSQPKDAQAYDEGDLWANATYPASTGATYSNDLLRCKTGKEAGNPFSINHWEKASKYTDDSALTSWLNTYATDKENLQGQIDGKVNTWYQSANPSTAWTTHELKASHTGDLWYYTGNTTETLSKNATYRWDGSTWMQQNAPQAVFDAIDGKRRVFVSTSSNPYPTAPYDIGDLWVNARYPSNTGETYNNDLLRCKTKRAAGQSFNISHWEKASKYTDDTAAEAVGQQLEEFKSDFTVQAGQIAAEVSQRVIIDNTKYKNSFGWKLDDNSHTWYSNNQEVMKVNSTGLSVKGSITATSGYIGTESQGFAIGETYLRNGKQSLTDAKDGVYIGTGGIALGKSSAFKVTDTGEVTAKNISVTGGSIAGWTITSDHLVREADTFRVRLNAFSSTSLNNNAISIATKEAGAATWDTQFSATYGGKVTAKNADISGKITAISGEIGGCKITNGVLKVPAANITGTLKVGGTGSQINGVITASRSETQYILHTNDDTGPAPAENASGWSTSVPTWESGKYIWTRTQTTNTISQEGDSRSEIIRTPPTGRYDRNLTNALATSAAASTSALAAESRSHTIYCSVANNQVLPDIPTSWVDAATEKESGVVVGGAQGRWTSIRPRYSSNYPALYTAVQRQSVGGEISNTAASLDATTTVIDGSHITTGKIDANRIQVSDLYAFGATIGGFTIGTKNIRNGKTTITDSQNGVYVGTDGIALGGSSSFKVDNQGNLTTSKINATGGTIGGCVIENGVLKVSNANITGTLTAGQIPNSVKVSSTITETEYYLSTSDSELTGGSWSPAVPTLTPGKYVWTRTKTTVTYSDNSKQIAYNPYPGGKYDGSFTTFGSTAKQSQLIYHSSSGGKMPDKPSAWVDEIDSGTGQNVDVGWDGENWIVFGRQNVWTPVRPEYDKNYPALYVSTQTKSANNSVTTTDPNLDVTTTVIDGAHIITGSIDANKIAVRELDALGATIGGFTIEATRQSEAVTGGHIYKGKSSLYSTSQGVYIGTDGIALGGASASKGVENNGDEPTFDDPVFDDPTIDPGTGGTTQTTGEFRVTKEGAVTATNLTITGGSININNKFRVDPDGSFTATSGTISGDVKVMGKVYASNIKYGPDYDQFQPINYGYFNGGGITPQTVTTGQTDTGINTSLGWADYSGNVFQGLQMATTFKISSSFYCGGYWFSPQSVTDHDGFTRVLLVATAYDD